MKSMRCLIVAAAALASSSAYAQITDGVVKIGVLTDMSSLYSDLAGAGSVAAAKLAVADFNPAAKGLKVEIIFGDHQNKPDIALEPRQLLVRRRQGRRHRRRRRIPASALAVERGRRSRRTSLCLVIGRGELRSHRGEVQRQHHPLGLRHLEPRQRHRQGGGQDRRQHLVLPHRRLRVRPGAGARHLRGRRGQWRQGARQGSRAHQHQRLLVVPAAGPGVAREGDRPRQCRRRHHQLDQAGGRVRHRRRRPDARRAAGVRERRRRARPADSRKASCSPRPGTGTSNDDEPRLDQALAGGTARQVSRP